MVKKSVTTILLENGNVYKLDFLPTPEEREALRSLPEEEVAAKYEYMGKYNESQLDK